MAQPALQVPGGNMGVPGFGAVLDLFRSPMSSILSDPNFGQVQQAFAPSQSGQLLSPQLMQMLGLGEQRIQNQTGQLQAQGISKAQGRGAAGSSVAAAEQAMIGQGGQDAIAQLLMGLLNSQLGTNQQFGQLLFSGIGQDAATSENRFMQLIEQITGALNTRMYNDQLRQQMSSMSDQASRNRNAQLMNSIIGAAGTVGAGMVAGPGGAVAANAALSQQR